MQAIVQPSSFFANEEIDFDRRFGGIARLYGAAALERFCAAHVCVIGVGGVGSWVVEALARSAIGNITMIDLDNVAESNVNRQLHALTDTLGKAKVTALAERIAQINPYCRVTEIEDFITEENLAQFIVPGKFDYVIDAIDNVRAKVALIAYCRQHGIRLLTIGGAGGQTDPTRIEIRDLCRTEQEPLLAKVRKRLRALHGFPRGAKNKFGIDAVFSTEPLRFPENAEACDLDGSLNCSGFGSAMAVTASFGLVAAAHILRKLADEALPQAVAAVANE
jgi:tRNA A37 threonylcarbamoyladenosine dehydratase